MKVLLRKNIAKLGIVGDIVEVAPGYARNYLFPKHLATEPTDANMRALAEARKVAEQERAEERARMTALAERIAELEVTIQAKANQEGVLYGSVGPREIAHALNAEGHEIAPEQVKLREPIRRLDNVVVEVQLFEDIRGAVKVWVVRERTGDEKETTPVDEEEPVAAAAESAESEPEASMEATPDDDSTAG